LGRRVFYLLTREKIQRFYFREEIFAIRSNLFLISHFRQIGDSPGSALLIAVPLPITTAEFVATIRPFSFVRPKSQSDGQSNVSQILVINFAPGDDAPVS
jgi:hypothetical protein